eukprot:m.144222 g.144222  ORF g.144222 m.144222 type:complete len:455 (-) comp20457_c0_seq1:65-1429(-)
MSSEAATPSPLDALRSGLRGSVYTRTDAEFADAVAAWSAEAVAGSTSQYVGVCLGAHDVRLCLQFAQESKLSVSVFGGGHSLAGKSLKGDFVISLRRINNVIVDPAIKTAWVGGGATWGDVDLECNQHGLACPGGAVSHTGVGGLTLGGGYDPACSRFRGMVIDSLLEVEIVLHNGDILRASATQNQELFWAVRGAGSAFGVVTGFKFQLFDVPKTCFGGPLAFPVDRYREILTFVHGELWRKLPDEITAYLGAFDTPAGRVVAVCLWCSHEATLPQARKVAETLRAKKPILDLCGDVPFPVLHTFFNPSFPYGKQSYYAKSTGIHINDMDAVLMDGLEARAKSMPPGSFLLVEHWGGKARPSTGCYSVAPDSSLVVLGMCAYNTDEEKVKQVEYAREVNMFVRGHTKKPVSCYMNFNEADGLLSEWFGKSELDKLRQLKTKWDPNNVFRFGAL